MSAPPFRPEVRDMLPTAAALTTAVAGKNRMRTASILATADTADLHALTVCLARYVDIKRLLADSPAPPSEFESIAQACVLVAPRFNTTVPEMRSASRSRNITEARMIAVYAARLNGMTFVAIGKYLNKDHTTAINAVNAVGERPRLRKIALEVAHQTGWDRNGAEAS